MIPRFLFAAFLILGAALPANAGEITRATAADDFQWKTTECVRPAKPFLRKDDPSRQSIMLRHSEQIARFIDCMKREAQRDYDRAQLDMQDAVQRALQAEVDAMNDQMEAVVRDSR